MVRDAKGINFEPVSPGDGHASFAEFIIRRPGNQGTETGELDRQWRELSPRSECSRLCTPSAHDLLYRTKVRPSCISA